MKLRTILFMLASLAFLSTSLGGYLYFSSLREAAFKEAERQAVSRVVTIEQSVSFLLSENIKAVKILAGLQELHKVLASPDENSLAEANGILDHFHGALEISVCYLMDRNGTTIASSNRHTSSSFVGKNYSFRPYFQQALQGIPAVYMALGVTSGERGVYYSHPIYAEESDSLSGVVIIKASVEGKLETTISNIPEGILVFTSPHGVVFVANRQGWLYKTLWKVSPDIISQIAATKQFGEGPWDWAGFERRDGKRAVDRAGNEYLVYEVSIENYPGWHILYFINLQEISERVFGSLTKNVGGIILTLWALIGVSVYLLYIRASHDITQRRKAEETLRESDKRLLQIIQGNSLPTFVINEEHLITHWNRACENLTGYSAHEMVGTRKQWMPFYPSERPCMADLVVNERPQEEIAGYYGGKYRKSEFIEGAYAAEAFFPNLGESGKWLLLSAAPLKGTEGKSSGAIETVQDISNRKENEIELQQSKETAEIANRAKSEFLANMSHELRTPLNHIIGFTELVVDQHFGALNETQEEYLNDVLQSSRHLLSLINDILDLSKVEAGKLELHLSEVDLATLLEHSLIMIKEKALKQRITLATDIKEISETIIADERKLKQILYNLLSNAVKFMPDGGEICLSANWVAGSELQVPGCSQLTTRNVQHATGEFIRIAVFDTGIGLKQEDLERIVHPFEQVEDSTSRRFQGTGLGLSLTKRLVELHGGRIWAESEGEGKGSTFTFVIPLKLRN